MAISINALHPLFAAWASGIDLSRPIDAADFGAIKAAVDRYGVLLLQGPRLTPEEQIAFAGLFGTLEPQNGVLTTGIAPRVTRKLVDISNLDENNAVLSQADRRRMFAVWHRMNAVRLVALAVATASLSRVTSEPDPVHRDA